MPTADVAHNVAAGGHVAFRGFALGDVYYRVEEVCLAVLTSEVLMVGEKCVSSRKSL